MDFLDGNVCYYIRIRNSRLFPYMFLGPRDYEYYLRLLKKYKQECTVRVFAFCLLPDSIHLILHSTSFPQIDSLMKHVQKAYRQYFCTRYDQGPANCFRHYKTFCLREDFSLFEYIKALELKPVHAEIATDPASYPWSSYSCRVLGEANNVVDKELVLSLQRDI